MRGDVARAVRDGQRLPTLPEAGERPERGPRTGDVRVVDGHGETASEGGDRGGPGGIPGEPDFGTVSCGGQRPPLPQPLRFRTRDGLPESLGAVPSYENHARHALRVHLGDLQRHVVQPLVGEQQPGDALRGLREPLDPVIKTGGAGGAFDGVPARAGGHFGGECGEDRGHQFAAARRHVDEGEGGRAAEGLVDAAQQPGHGMREERGGVHRGTEVTRGPFRPAIEAAGPVQRLLRRLAPTPEPVRFLTSHRARLSGAERRASTLGSTRGGQGSILRLTPAHCTLPYAGLRAAPL